MVTIKDLTTDFDAAVRRMADEAMREIEGMSEAQRADHWLLCSLAHLHKMIVRKAPDFLIDLALKRAAKHIRRVQKSRRQSAGVKST